MSITVSEVMTHDPITVEDWASLTDVANELAEHHVRHLPVVEDGRLVGLLSHRDLLRFTSTDLDHSPLRDARDRTLKELAYVSQVMTRDVETITPDMLVVDAVKKLVANRFGCLPVVDADGNLLGIVSDHDLLTLLSVMLKLADEGKNVSEALDWATRLTASRAN